MFLVRKVLIGEKVCITFYVGSVWDQLRIENKNFGQQTLMKPVTTRHLTRAGCHVLRAGCHVRVKLGLKNYKDNCSVRLQN